LFSLLPDVASFHEPEPKFSHVLRQVQHKPVQAREFLQNSKLPAIAKYERSVYVETSHLFCKGFLEPAQRLGLRFDLIVLRRSARDVARSLYELGTIPARTNWGRSFLLAPNDPGVLPLPGWETMHDYQLCYWYCLEIERRAKLYPQLVAAHGGRTAKTSLSELLAGGFSQVLESLAVPVPEDPNLAVRIKTVMSSPVNAKHETKNAKERPPIDNYEALEKAVRERMGPKIAEKV
jgi:hypothetical protein